MVAVVYALLTLMGFIPGLNTTFGLIPLYGNDIWLHALLAAVAAYFGWAHATRPELGTVRHQRPPKKTATGAAVAVFARRRSV